MFKKINNVVKTSCVPVVLFQFAMLSFFLIRGNKSESLAAIFLFVITIGYLITNFRSFIYDIYSIHEKLEHYEKIDCDLDENEIAKWRLFGKKKSLQTSVCRARNDFKLL